MFSASSSNSKTTQTALGYGLRILAKKDYTRNEMLEKMQEKGFGMEDITKTIIYLESKKFIDDKRVANNIVEFYGPSKGKIWLKGKMVMRKMNSLVMEEVIGNLGPETESMPENQLISLRRLLEGKFKIDDWDQIEYTSKAKVFQYLVRRGFTSPLSMIQKFKEIPNIKTFQ